MITDAEYDADELALTPIEGVLAGFVGAGFMMATVALLAPVSNLPLRTALGNMAGTMLGPGQQGKVGVGAIVAVVFCGILGLLYALCQQRIETAGFVTVGLFYGFTIWVFSRLFLRFFVHGSFRGNEGSWAWLVGTLVFGLTLAVAAIVRERFRPAQTLIVAID